MIKLFARSVFLCFWCIVFWNMVSPGFSGSIVDSKHNLSVSGPGTVKALDESEICIFCHTPHNASSAAPLWNRYDSGQTYIPYSSSTAQATIGQPTGASKVCLSCHDGTVALGMVRSRPTEIPFVGGMGVLPPGDTNLGTDLSDDHPISFHYDTSLASQNLELKDPSNLTGPVRLDKNGELQCTACHDPHNDQYGDFLCMDGIDGNLCNECHEMEGWNECVHTTGYTWNGSSPDPWPYTEWNSVRENACQNCHRPHNAGSSERLLNYEFEEPNCEPCHNGNVALKNVIAEFSKPSIHPIYDTAGVHDPAEAALISTNRHVECIDCHNPHAATWLNWYPDLLGENRYVQGVDIGGVEVDKISFQYELCFRCHGDTSSGQTYVNRQNPETNTRIEFSPVNASYHPVTGVGRNSDVPSLIYENPSYWNTTSIMRCTHCHYNDAFGNPPGANPRGPHGSIYAPILERQLSFTDGERESYDLYALCYKCHDRNSIMNSESFPYHTLHIDHGSHFNVTSCNGCHNPHMHSTLIITGLGTPCTTCHDPHGVQENTHLINFDVTVVSPSSSGVLSFEDLGTYSGRCYLTCHGSDHNPYSY